MAILPETIWRHDGEFYVEFGKILNVDIFEDKIYYHKISTFCKNHSLFVFNLKFIHITHLKIVALFIQKLVFLI